MRLALNWFLNKCVCVCLHTFSSPVKQPDKPKHPCLYKPVRVSGETWASHSAKATGDPLLDSLPARGTNQPQDPDCFRASLTTRIICLTNASWVRRPWALQQTPFCPPTVCCKQDGDCEPKEVDPAEASQLDESADMEVGSCEEEWGPPEKIHLDTLKLAWPHLNLT